MNNSLERFCCDFCGLIYCKCKVTTCLASPVEDNSENLARLREIKERTQGVNVLALNNGDLLWLITMLEEVWE